MCRILIMLTVDCKTSKQNKSENKNTKIMLLTYKYFGKNLVFAMTIKLIPEFWRNQEIPEKFWKTYEQVKLDLFPIFYLFLILFLIPSHPIPSPDQPPYDLT